MIGHAAYQWVISRPWAIEQSMLDTIIEISLREGEGAEAVAARMGRPLDNTRCVTMRDGVACVPIHGVISQRASMFSDISGGCSTDQVALDLQTAMDNPGVRAIMLDIDSPGGQAAGIGQLADMIYACRGKKPIKSYVSGQACSAGYWLASAADEVIVSPHSQGGSIGTVMQRRDTSEREARAGIKTEQYVSAQSPKKRPDTSTESGRSVIQDEVNKLADLFIHAVARNRGTTADDVEENFGQGATKFGEDMVASGMANRLGTYESVIAELARPQQPGVSPSKPAGLAASTSLGARKMSDTTESGVVAGPDLATLMEQLKAATALNESLGKANAQLLNDKIQARAEAYASGLIHDSRILGVEKAGVISAFVQAAVDDSASPLATGSRVALVESLYANRPRHSLGKGPQIPEGNPAIVAAMKNGQIQVLADQIDVPDGKGTSDAEIKALMALDPVYKKLA